VIRYSVATLRDPLDEERGHEITYCETLYR
jgi:hypothetical protein